MVRPRGTYFVVGYGGELRVPTFDLVLPEISVVGTYDDLRELVAFTAAGGVSLRTRTYPLEAFADAIADPGEQPHARAGGVGPVTTLNSRAPCTRDSSCACPKLGSASLTCRPATERVPGMIR